MKYIYFFSILLPAFFFSSESAQAQTFTTPVVKIFDSQSFTEQYSFTPFADIEGIHSMDIEVVDLNDDGVDEFIISAGGQSAPYVRVFNAQGQQLNEFLAYAEHFRGGVHLAVADVDNDGKQEIITAAQNLGGPHVRIFDSFGNVEGGFFAFDKELRGGVNLAVGELHPMDGLEIVTASGRGMNALVRVFNRYGDVLYEFDPGFDGIAYGLVVQVVDLEQDGVSEILVSAKAGYEPITKIFTPDGQLKGVFEAYQKSFRGGVNLEFAQLRADAPMEIITGAGFGGGSHVRFFDHTGVPIIKPNFFVFEGFRGGILVESGNLLELPGQEIVVATQYIPQQGKDRHFQYIEVDVFSQIVTTYEFGRVRDNSKISTGIVRFPTPLGNFSVQRKIESKTYEWSYGPRHADNYSLPNVKHNLMFKWPYYLHGAYWHSNFGQRMSHGCVNLPLEYAEKLYAWAQVGAAVTVLDSSRVMISTSE